MPEIDTTPFWRDSASTPHFGALARDLEVDVVVIGAGITGITAAYLLKRAGRRVALIERDRVACAASGHTTAHLTCVTDTRLTALIRDLGVDHARGVWDAGLAAIVQMAEHVRREQIECHFAHVPGYLHASLDEPPDAEVDTLRHEAQAAAELGFEARYLDRVPYVDRPGMEIAGQARIHPRKYLAGLLRKVDGDGCHVFEQSAVDAVEHHPDDSFSLKANGHTIRCGYVVFATHNSSVFMLRRELALYTSYVIGGPVHPGRVPDALFWDTAEPYRYLRLEPHRGFDFVIFGGEDHPTAEAHNPRECYAHLEAALAHLVPDVEITHHWSGPVIETHDGLPFIGEIAPRQFMATGFAGNGMTFGTLGAMMATDAVLERDNPWRELFDRFTAASAARVSRAAR